MLLELKIKNLAIIESVEANFGTGLNVITGETGAGKSILLAALNLVIGGRSDKELIRSGEDEASVEAVFSNTQDVCDLLDEWGIQAEVEEPIILRRTLHISGRSRAFVNCAAVPTNQIRKLAPLILDFGRQHEQSVLMNAEQHVQLLDRYANQTNDKVAKKYREVVELEKEFSRLEASKSSRVEKKEFLIFQKNNIEQVDLQPNEEDELTNELNRLSDIDHCRDLARNCEKDLYKRPDNIHEQLAHVVSNLTDLSVIDASVEHVVKDLENALISVQEAADSLHSYEKGLHADPEQIEDVQDRLDQVIELQNRYGGTYESVIERYNEIDKELAELEEKDKRQEALHDIIEKAKKELCQRALKLSNSRQKAAQKLMPLIQKELHDLAMENASFDIDLQKVSQDPHAIAYAIEGKLHYINSNGMENVYFLFSANKGEELRSLEKVASGGEMSRIMLAIKRIIGGAFAVPTVIFDEIDSGISGQASTSVAQKLRQIVDDDLPPQQIICISHTAQVAAEADHHFLVQKQTVDERTHSRIVKMNYKERLDEVARMLAGDQSKTQALALAEKLVKK
ncbi:DNA repair protein RecN [Candidatus Uabimicrobium amorphum]|uniref:DNA repair protein RecN n=1 Tax=Uabimicrobium amorphum TaxID=2596890 RepID=A0A5S9F6S4_UABAM|nr:DNA repair protein RecN [Candidatus Uabimicrobium amorphum]BBM87513.1 DNA repair protein RecN [Candidatus Uabimicrobium amorphum]